MVAFPPSCAPSDAPDDVLSPNDVPPVIDERTDGAIVAMMMAAGLVGALVMAMLFTLALRQRHLRRVRQVPLSLSLTLSPSSTAHLTPANSIHNR